MNQLACQSNNIYEKRQDNQFIHYVNQVWNFYFNFLTLNMKIALLLLVPYKTSQTESFTEELVLAYKEAECPSERERA